MSDSEVQSANVPDENVTSAGSTTLHSDAHPENAPCMLLMPVRAVAAERSASRSDAHPEKALLRLVSPVQPERSMVASFSQFMNALLQLAKLAAPPPSGITTASSALQFTKAPFFDRLPCTYRSVPGSIAAWLMSMRRSALLVAMKPDVPRATASSPNAAVFHVPVSLTTSASRRFDGMAAASTVISVCEPPPGVAPPGHGISIGDL